MNCKPGDLAIIVAPNSPNRDRIVRCIRLLRAGEEMSIGGFEFVATSDGTFWAVEGWINGAGPDGVVTEVPGGPVRDRWLRPIRDPGDDAVDEMLLRVGLPEGETV